VRLGKPAASASPIWACAAATRRSAAAMSGRRCSSVAGSNSGTRWRGQARAGGQRQLMAAATATT
jgi:hypothetical protein